MLKLTLQARLALLLCAALAGWPAQAAPPAADAIRIATSDLPPYSMEAAPGAPGALYDMVAELTRRTQQPSHIEFVPWQRAIYLSTSLRRTAIFPLSRLPDRENQYRWLARLYYEQFLFLSVKASHFDVHHPELGKERRIGVLRGSASIKSLRDHGYKQIVEASSIDESVRYLQRGIVDAVYSDRNILRRALLGRDEAEFLFSEPLMTTTTWLAGSLDFSDADAALFQKAMKEMIDDGSYAQILKKYGLTPAPESAPRRSKNQIR